MGRPLVRCRERPSNCRLQMPGRRFQPAACIASSLFLTRPVSATRMHHATTGTSDDIKTRFLCDLGICCDRRTCIDLMQGATARANRAAEFLLRWRRARTTSSAHSRDFALLDRVGRTPKIRHCTIAHNRGQTTLSDSYSRRTEGRGGRHRRVARKLQ